ncbi:MAG: hypothetical protein ACI81V_001320 [Lentimonas sp.]|jgi:hypothetical protein
MLKLYYKWRYKRSQQADSFKLPKNLMQHSSKRINLVSYLKQDSVRGRAFNRFDLPRKRKHNLKVLLCLSSIALLTWLIYESFKALVFFK